MFFSVNDDSIRVILQQPDSHTYILIWHYLPCLIANDCLVAE